MAQDNNTQQPTAPQTPQSTPAQPVQSTTQPQPQAPQSAPATQPQAQQPTPVAQTQPAQSQPQTQTPQPVTQPQPQASQPVAEPQPQPQVQPTPAVTSGCKCPDVKAEEWDKKNPVINKLFYKTWSPRLLYYPFSFVIDIDRAMTGAAGANYKIPSPTMILDTGGMFWSSVMVEVEGAKEGDKNIVSLAGKKLYTKVSKRPWMQIKFDIEELKKEIGKDPLELYLWYTACPKCMDKKEIKTILIAVI